MSWIAAATAGASIINGISANNASNAQQASSAASIAEQQAMFNDIKGRLAPYTSAGSQDLSTLQSLLNNGPNGLLHNFNAQDLNSYLAPNYQFQLGQGEGALQNQAAAAGGALSGNSLAGMQNYAQNYAGNAYQNAFQNYVTNQNNIYSRLGNLAQLGQASATNSATGASLFSNGISNSITGAGNAAAAGDIGVGNAFSSGLSNVGNYYMLNNLSGGKLFGGGGGGGNGLANWVDSTYN